jgi:antitoxin ParD1/3/4
MNISLTTELELFVQNKVNSGLYTSASEVIRESLRLLYSQDYIKDQRVKQLNQAIDVGLNQLATGERIPASESYERLKKKIDTMSQRG